MEFKCRCLSVYIWAGILVTGILVVSSADNVRDEEVQGDDPRRSRALPDTITTVTKSHWQKRRLRKSRFLPGFPGAGPRPRFPPHHPRNLLGNYSRIYTESIHESHLGPFPPISVNQTVRAQTQVTFVETGSGVVLGTGSHIQRIQNKTSGLNSLSPNLTLEYTNVTSYFDEDSGGSSSSSDNTHPLTTLTNRLFEEHGRGNLDAGKKRGGYLPTRPHPCDQRSCYPQTGNLLIGRETNLTASSTCGLRGAERYCVISHLEDKKKCFRCDSTDQYKDNPGLSHRIDNILHRFHPGSSSEKRSWWQSENGMENVSIQLDLEAEFHFTHMIITFKTFRPAAMLIERSTDFGKTWKVYRYFAYNCRESFPNATEGLYTSINDVICESRYSSVAPSSEGEVIFRVLPQNVNIPDPYAEEVQDLLKMTNLRINFTKLHTLGDDLLDRRQEIQEKYYYAIYEMVVRGSCSCYGHASRCLPGPYATYGSVDPLMIHGQCECTHNTKGLNCGDCEDFHFDVPWKPAFGKQSNACKRCNCNNHATSCKFDKALYAASGNVSGGYCEDCQHNTIGPKCSMCKRFFYLRPDRDISDEDACHRCECDSRGSLDEGICDPHTDAERNTVAGSCHCKRYAAGQRCNSCAVGYWDLQENNPEGCKPCSCNTLGTEGNQGCNVDTGSCTCKTYVTGRDCNQCLPGFWGLSEDRDGCKPCDCDIGGSFHNNCDVFSGKCRCRPHVNGRNCSTPEQGFFAPTIDYFVYEAELARTSPNSQFHPREPYSDGRPITWTGAGFVRAFDDSYLEFLIDNIATSMDYDLVIRYEPQQAGWNQINVFVIPDKPPDPDGPCANAIQSTAPTTVLLRSEAREQKMYTPLCLENGTTYTVRLEVAAADHGGPSSSILIDSIALIPRTEELPFFHGDQIAEYRRREFEYYQCGVSAVSAVKREEMQECKNPLHSVGYYVYNGATECACNLTGSLSAICGSLGGQCQCKPNVVGRDCSRCAPGTSGFGPEGCRPCECNPVGSLDNFCFESGQCRCREKTYGLQCDQCQPGYWGFPNCRSCNCNGHADTCEAQTGICIDCRNNATGSGCDRCMEGFYGDPRLGYDIPCRACPCPGTNNTIPKHSFASRCALDRQTNDVICKCDEGYAGPRCDACAENHFGNPEVPGGSCSACDCNNNIDLSRPGNCDSKTGQCLQCLFQTDGFSCEQCRAGYYGDAVRQTCLRCVCNMLGTDPNKTHCDPNNGQCLCLPNVQGLQCDSCAENHWKIASGKGCEACACDPVGSTSTQCNLYDGQCDCKAGFGGRKCDQCEANFWGDPSRECYACDCNPVGSSTMQCDRTNGSCVCIPGIGGHRCGECARGYISHEDNRVINRQPNRLSCYPCGECFENWDRIIGDLKRDTTAAVSAASEIKQQGTTGAYSGQFDVMQARIDEVKNLIKSSSVSSLDLAELQDMIDLKKKELSNSSAALDSVGEILATVSQKVLLTNVSLAELEKKADALQFSADSLKDKAINLQEANVEGALTLTKEAKRKSDDAVRRVDDVQKLVRASETQRHRVDALLASLGPKRNKTQEELTNSLGKLDTSLNDISNDFPALNTLVCDKGGDPCDSHCGGAGCGKCGGISCEGAVTKAEQALKFAQEAHTELKSKDAKAEELLRAVIQTKKEVDEAKDLAQSAFNITEKATNVTEVAKKTLEGLETEIQEFLNQTFATPVDIRTLAEEVLKQNITLQPAQIDQLAVGIRESITKLSNIDQINYEAGDDLQTAEGLKRHADAAAAEANKVLQEAVQVRSELEKAEEAQKNAELAIETAREDITQADIYLKQIGSETEDAEKKAGEGLREVVKLKGRLEELQKKNLQNERRRAQAKEESDSAYRNATAVQENAAKLNAEYNTVFKSLENKLKRFEGAKGKDEIQNRANHLANNVKQKLVELQEMETEYQDHERRATDLSSEIGRLSAQMEEHLGVIREIEEYHGRCNP